MFSMRFAVSMLARVFVAGALACALALGVAAAPANAATSPHPLVLLKTTKGPILIKLFANDAPISCANFVKLVNEGFYNGLMFHRVADLGGAPGQGHIVQGGDPLSRHAKPGDPSLGSGGSPDEIKGEFTSNGVNNPLTHVAGAVAMARSSDNNSASSQFYICTTPVHEIDGSYAVFGMVIKGLDNAAKIVVGDRITSATIVK
jgi:peptidyl-prolyl cis-trans isomerase B (cyclophilin B)